MTKSKEQIVNVISAMFVALLCYAALSKLINYEDSRKAMLNQVFTREFALLLVWLVPVIELLIIVLLLFKKTCKLGLWSATLLLVSFSMYLILANNGVFKRTPCGCGGILGRMDYREHLTFNICFVVLGFLGIVLSKGTTLINRWFNPNERRSGKIG